MLFDRYCSVISQQPKEHIMKIFCSKYLTPGKQKLDVLQEVCEQLLLAIKESFLDDRNNSYIFLKDFFSNAENHLHNHEFFQNNLLHPEWKNIEHFSDKNFQEFEPYITQLNLDDLSTRTANPIMSSLLQSSRTSVIHDNFNLIPTTVAGVNSSNTMSQDNRALYRNGSRIPVISDAYMREIKQCIKDHPYKGNFGL